ncbi:MAG TPA: CGNR zinc finger domain-containing protein [Nocardioidaceae bacterium]|nr:CGNR zinc finger domain-containing protein [Nocardioidaceae bacterium]
MEAEPSYFPPDWLPAGRQSATDLDLAVLLVNSVDLLADPPDRLDDLQWLQAAFTQAGHAGTVVDLADADLPRLRALRAALRTAFEAESAAAAADALNPVLDASRAVLQLTPDSGADTYSVVVGSGRKGIAALEARLPAALAAHIAAHGPTTLGVCASDPCRCAFVDRTRGRTRRYCCSYCNDRAAARAYRRRRKA